MANIFATPEKKSTRDRLFQIGLETLHDQGFKVERIPKCGKASVRRITKAGKSQKVAIRTSQDRLISFPRDHADKIWVTLSEVDVVIVVSVDDSQNPKFALVHMIDADQLRQRFDRSYRARMEAGYRIPVGHGVWLSLYDRDATEPVNHVGAGVALDYPEIARVPLEPEGSYSHATVATKALNENDKPLFIPEAKRRLAKTFGVEESSIKITVEA
jgi:hypothetical protein